MQWEGKEEGGRVEDRRGMKGGIAAGGGIGALILAAVVYLVTGDPNAAKQAANQVGGGGGGQQAGPGVNDREKKFSETILGMTNKVWDEQFKRQGVAYKHPELVLFSDAVKTGGCGNAPSAVGPFYCPADRKLYIDPTFFIDLEKKLGGSADDFSKAYVIAHEVGHHVQNLLGYNARLDDFKREGKNAGIRLELQADYLAGVWAHHAEQKYRILEHGDVEKAVKTANAIGDDKLSGPRASPQGFTHGTSRQRMKYLQQGLQTGKFDKATLDHFFDPGVDPLQL